MIEYSLHSNIIWLVHLQMLQAQCRDMFQNVYDYEPIYQSSYNVYIVYKSNISMHA